MKTSNIISLLGLFLLISCGRDADVISAKTQLIADPFVAPLMADNGFSEEVRDATFIVFPNENEVKDFSYAPREAEQEGEEADWEAVFKHLPYGKKLARGIPQKMGVKQKIKEITEILLAAGGLRDRFYVDIYRLDKEIEGVRAELAAKLAPIFAQYPCYTITAGENRRKCSLIASENTAQEAKYSKSCSALERDMAKFTGLTEEQQNEFKASVAKCNEISVEDEAVIDGFRAEKAPKDAARPKAKGIVLDLLKKAEAEVGARYIFTTSTQIDPDVEQNKSVLKLTSDNLSIEDLKLYVDFGDGSRLYSLENGLVKDLKYYRDRDGVRMLEFTIQTQDFKVKTKTAASVSYALGLRFVGTCDVQYPNGMKREGLFKLEFDAK